MAFISWNSEKSISDACLIEFYDSNTSKNTKINNVTFSIDSVKEMIVNKKARYTSGTMIYEEAQFKNYVNFF